MTSSNTEFQFQKTIWVPLLYETKISSPNIINEND